MRIAVARIEAIKSKMDPFSLSTKMLKIKKLQITLNYTYMTANRAAIHASRRTVEVLSFIAGLCPRDKVERSNITTTLVGVSVRKRS